MTQLLFTTIFSAFSFAFVMGQAVSKSVYKSLETKKFYSVGLSSRNDNGKTTYKVNGKAVSKSIYSKYESTWQNMEKCCPCILQSYNEKDVLIKEAVSCTDCIVGAYKEFYANGKVKLSGGYKENPTGNWNNIWQRVYCNVRHGEWAYYNEQGDSLYSETWNNGEFVKQTPEQPTNEIWKVELSLSDKPVEQTTISPTQVKQLIVVPKYKNSSQPSAKLRIKFQVSAVGYIQNEYFFSLTDFNSIDVVQMLNEVGIPTTENVNYTLSVLDGEKTIANFILNIKP